MSRVFRVEAGGTVWIPAFRRKIEEEEPADARVRISAEDLLEQARREAAAIRHKAEQEACNILEDARRQSLEICRQAEKQGFDAGYKAGFSQGLDQAQGYVEKAKQALESAQQAYARYIEQAEPKLLALVLEVAKKVVGEAITYDPELIISMLRQGIEAMGDERKFVLRVNPKLVAFVQSSKQGLEREFGVEITEVVGDPSVSAGAILDTPSGQIDATVETQIENLARAIGEARNCVGEPAL